MTRLAHARNDNAPMALSHHLNSVFDFFPKAIMETQQSVRFHGKNLFRCLE
tara:strand:+ start:1824 stop:1976 length:153 start_codon:yes stop_codon:yes gene_type:complete